MHRAVLKLHQREGNQGSETRLLVVFGLKLFRPRGSSGIRRPCRARALSLGSHFRQNPMNPVRSSPFPPFLVSGGLTAYGVIKRSPAVSAIPNEWWPAGESARSISQNSKLWQLDGHAPDAAERRDYPSHRGASSGRSRFPPLDFGRFVAPQNLFYRTR